MKTYVQLLALITFIQSNVAAQLFEKHAVLDGNGDYYFSNNILPNGSFTVEFYFRICDDSSLNIFSNLVTNCDDFILGLKKQFEDGEYHFDDRVCEGGIGGACSAGDVAILTTPEGNEWHHVALVFNKTTKCLSSYFDGVPYGGVCSSEYTLSSKDLYIGRAFNLYYNMKGFRGQIDEIRVSNYTRYTSTFTPPASTFVDDPNTIAIWHMDSAAAEVIEDASGGGHDLIAYGDAHLFTNALYTPTISGPITVDVDEIYTYSSPDLPEYMTATWSTTGALITPGVGDTAYITWSDIGSYILNVHVVDLTGCDIFTNSINIHVIDQQDCVPEIEICNSLDDDCNGITDDGITVDVNISAEGPTTFCQGGSVILNAIYSGTSVQWKRGGVDIIGATTSSFTVTQKGVYTCETVSSCGNALSNSINVTVNKNPNASISALGLTTFCPGESVTLIETPSAGCSYQWYKGVTPIAGETATNYLATTSGNYKCKVTKTATGCSKTSNSINVNATCKLGESNFPLVIYPNPVNDNLILECQSGMQGFILIYSITGQIIYSNTIVNSKIVLDVSNFSDGLYIIKYKNENSEYIKEFIKN